MNSRHRRTFEALFADPIDRSIEWRRIEALLLALGAEIEEGQGSRVAFMLRGEKWATHRPHPEKEAFRYHVKDVRTFLTNAGITP